MPQKMLLTTKERIKAVEDCKNEKESIHSSSKKYGVSRDAIKNWIRMYEMRGAKGLTPTEKSKKYSVETKKSAVNDYLSGKGSLNEICKKYDISRKIMLQRWIKWYNSHGEFKEPNSGGGIYMTKGRKTTLNERVEIVSHCIASNKDYGKTIEQYGVSYQQIYGWVRKYEMNGTDGLSDNRGKRKDESTMSEVEKLNAQLKLKEAENFRLRMENELLKKLDALERGIKTD